MRYDTLLKAIERATSRYESEIRQVLRQFAKDDAATATALIESLKKNKDPHWTQRPENKARLRKMRKEASKKKAVKRVS